MSEPVIFIIGDHRSPTGPANVTREYIEGLKRKNIPFEYLKSSGKLGRFFELIFKLPKASVTFFSGYSRQNILGMTLSALSGKPSIYLMHGSVEYENEINKVPDPYMVKCEYEMLKKASLILAVSERFEGWLKDRYPEFSQKTGHLTNGVDWKGLNAKGDAKAYPGDNENAAHHREKRVISIGGGMPRKRIASICEAIELLRRRTGEDITLTVIGDKGADSEKINGYSCVNNLGMKDASDVPEILRAHEVYIQNSVFETFGLSVLEALCCGNDILVSKCCGCLEVLGGVRDEDLIEDPDDPEEIADKLENLFEAHNNARIMESTDTLSSGWDRRVEELFKICRKTVRG